MTTSISLQRKRTRLWVGCVLLSITGHILVGGILYKHPLILSNPLQSLFGISLAAPKSLPHDTDIDAIDKNFLLEDVFRTVVVAPSSLHAPHDLPQGVALTPSEEQPSQEVTLAEEPSLFSGLIDKKLLSKEAILKELQEISPSPLLQTLEEEAREVSHPSVDDTLSSIPVPFVESILPPSHEERIALEQTPAAATMEKELSSSLEFNSNGMEIASRKEEPLSQVDAQTRPLLSQEKKPSLFIPKTPTLSASPRTAAVEASSPRLDQYSFPPLSPSALWDDDFTADVSYLPHPEGKGYLFALSLYPVKNLDHHKLKHNFYFVLDRSASSQKHRFSVFKRATLKALSSIQPEDTFNILIVDKHITKFSAQNLAATLKNRRAAEEFLDAQESSGLFNSGSIYSSLHNLLPLIPDNQELHSIILLSDGQNKLGASKKKDLFTRWITENEGKVTLYAAAVGQDDDLLSLDLLSAESGGRLLYSDTHASFPRKLAKLVMDLHTPLAKQLDISVKPHPSLKHIELYPATYMLAPLYANEPYLIVGEIDALTPFELIIEGRHNEDWIRINKHISFKKAKAAEPQLIKQWRKMRSGVCYARFLEEGSLSHLQEAKELLNRSQREIAFE